MGIGTSLLLIAVGAILKFAVSVDGEGFNLNTIGLILMLVGIVGLILSLVMGSALASRRHGTVVERRRDVL